MSNIRLTALSFSYDNQQTVLNNIYFEAKEDQTIGLIGANGAGKSTLLKLLVGLLTPTNGAIYVDGLLLEKKTLPVIRRKIGYVFQDSDHQLFMPTVYEDVAFGPRNYGYPPLEVERLSDLALEKVHMTSFKSTPNYKLSGGQKKLVALATILSLEPKIILLDEPSTALDPRNRRHFIEIINSMSSLKLIASHDLDLIFDTCERTLLLSDHQIIADGATQEILKDEALLKAHGLELPLRFQ